MEQAIKDIKEAGQLQRIKKKWTQPKAECGSLLMTGTTLDFEKLAGPFLIIILGVVLALLLVISEKAMASLERKDEKQEKLNFEEEITCDDRNANQKRIEPRNDGLFELPYENRYEVYSKCDIDRMILLLKREKENDACQPIPSISDASQALQEDVNELIVLELS